jgi:hypothetical protein
VPLILDHSYLVGNLAKSKIAATKALEPLKSWHSCTKKKYQQFSNSLISQRDMSGPRLGALSNNTWSGVLTPWLLRTCCKLKRVPACEIRLTWGRFTEIPELLIPQWDEWCYLISSRQIGVVVLWRVDCIETASSCAYEVWWRSSVLRSGPVRSCSRGPSKLCSGLVIIFPARSCHLLADESAQTASHLVRRKISPER